MRDYEVETPRNESVSLFGAVFNMRYVDASLSSPVSSALDRPDVTVPSQIPALPRLLRLHPEPPRSYGVRKAITTP